MFWVLFAAGVMAAAWLPLQAAVPGMSAELARAVSPAAR